MSKLILLYGLPGAGKSTWLAHNYGARHDVFDDFMASSIEDRSAFIFCRRLGHVVTALRSQRSCLLCDIRLCEVDFRKEVVSEIRALVPTVSIEWHCFDCATSDIVERCRRNVAHRERLSGKLEPGTFRCIDKYSQTFSIEPGAVIHYVVEASP